MAGLTAVQLAEITDIERACSVLSLLGCLFIIVTFCLSRNFSKPINRLVFYASFGNMITNVGTLMSRDFLNSTDSFGCQFQAFLIQTFMPADAFWTLAMAINVYLTFYYKFDAEQLRKIEPIYMACCYGLPMIPGLTFLWLKNQEGQRVYGNAVAWCWISSDWNKLRVAAFYGPVWIIILITLFIYLRAGYTIYQKRKQLQTFHSTGVGPTTTDTENMYSMKTTEVTVTTETISTTEEAQPDHASRCDSSASSGHGDTYSPYSVVVSAKPAAMSSQQALTVQVAPPLATSSARRRNRDVNNAAWSYTKCAILFFTAILITWIPSSANRVYSVVHTNSVSVPLQYMSVFVLPLQGFWNAAIYAVTSWTACRNLFNDIWLGTQSGVSEQLGRLGLRKQRQKSQNF